ncbi:MAG: flagellar biosynthesis anti-sigma factor FlgM [Planctomycetes bacterium]|nr:flagellar biosynthesis anti-sigma factor FlgM [Planctomycetota bacterium]
METHRIIEAASVSLWTVHQTAEGVSPNSTSEVGTCLVLLRKRDDLSFETKGALPRCKDINGGKPMVSQAKKRAQKRREDALRSFDDDRKQKVLKLRELIRSGSYDVDGKFEAIFEELLEDIKHH